MSRNSYLSFAALVAACVTTSMQGVASANEGEQPRDCDTKVVGTLLPQCVIEAVPDGSYLNNVCHLKIQRKFLWSTSTNYGSAFVYKGRYLLTAGHNVYQQKSRIQKIEVRCGKSKIDETSEPDFLVVGDDWFEASRFYHPVPLLNKDFGDDFGVIKLPTDVSGALSIGFAAAPLAKGGNLAIAGFPSGTLSNSLSLYGARGKVETSADRSGIMTYNIQTYTGNSGGPIFTLGADNQPNSLAAIHVTASGGRAVRSVRPDSDLPENERDFITEIERLIQQVDDRTS